ncbi:MAG: hypothetical protein ACP5KA_02595 [Desulfurococcaceae archaeon]
MGRRRKRRRVIPKRVFKVPLVFECPNCASKSLSITIKKSGDRASAVITCSNCGLVDDEDFADIPAFYETVHVYSKFVDLYNSGTARVKILKTG